MINNIDFVNFTIGDSCESFDFDAETGIMTLKGNVIEDQIKDFSKKEKVIEITAQEGTVFPIDCSRLFFKYNNTLTINLGNVDTSKVIFMSDESV